MALSVEQRRIEPDVTVLEFFGRFMAGRESQAMETATLNLLARHEKRLIFDLTALDYMDSTGIGQISKYANRLELAGAEVRIAARGLVREVLAITRIDSVLSVNNSVEEAIAAFGRTPPEPARF